MKNQVINQYTLLSSKEITTINGGCGGEDIECPELELLQEVLDNLKHLLAVL
ncbi:hypothetical protein [Aquimarina atlantica]|uniref:hypothetical protein n=1 Tax=Aquimarina atlantica TaxID=1317122 RepID=UPI000AD4919F|nr:hypothetical protein [Aquimarina atlantica]